MRKRDRKRVRATFDRWMLTKLESNPSLERVREAQRLSSLPLASL